MDGMVAADFTEGDDDIPTLPPSLPPSLGPSGPHHRGPFDHAPDSRYPRALPLPAHPQRGHLHLRVLHALFVQHRHRGSVPGRPASGDCLLRYARPSIPPSLSPSLFLFHPCAFRSLSLSFPGAFFLIFSMRFYFPPEPYLYSPRCLPLV